MILREIPYRRREYHGRDSSANILAQAVWAQREESLPRLVICRQGREHGPIIGINAQMGVRRIARQLRKLVPQFELTTGYSSVVMAAAIRGIIGGREPVADEVVADLTPTLREAGLQVLH